MTGHEAANAATPDQKAVHSIPALLTYMFHAVAILNLLDCAEEAVSFGDRRGTAQRHTVLQYLKCTQCARWRMPKSFPNGFTQM